MNQNIFILIGSNLGNRSANLTQSLSLIEKYIGRITNQSSVYETAAWGKTDEPNYLNQVAKIESDFSATEVLQKCLSIEIEMGRVRKEKWEARIIDIDLLYFGNEIFNSEELTIPHPRLHERKFTLIPLTEMDEEFVHPILKMTNRQLLMNCSDELLVTTFKG